MSVCCCGMILFSHLKGLVLPSLMLWSLGTAWVNPSSVFLFLGGHAAFVRRPQPSDEVRVLDLFAGLGGWEHAVDLLAPILGRKSVPLHEFVSVEIDPLCAEVLAVNS